MRFNDKEFNESYRNEKPEETVLLCAPLINFVFWQNGWIKLPIHLREDLEQEAWLGLLDNIRKRRYKGGHAGTFFARVIKNVCLNALTRWSRQSRINMAEPDGYGSIVQDSPFLTENTEFPEWLTQLEFDYHNYEHRLCTETVIICCKKPGISIRNIINQLHQKYQMPRNLLRPVVEHAVLVLRTEICRRLLPVGWSTNNTVDYNEIVDELSKYTRILELIKVIGIEKTQSLLVHFGGMRIEIPEQYEITNAVNRVAIRRAYAEQPDGVDLDKLSKEIGLTPRKISGEAKRLGLWDPKRREVDGKA